jgi:2-desacetyl-2-hydroxyethyl bacteriochlorophyllide A dehydrogenase
MSQEMMKVARLFGPNDMRFIEMPIPEPGPHEVVCKVHRVGICGTDHAIYTAEASFMDMVHFPMTLGHEWSGTVYKVGRDVTQHKPGDRVTGDTGVACGFCTPCLMGNWGYCKQAQAVGTVNAWDGAYAEYILFPERHLFHLEDSIPLDNGAFTECAATALYSVKKANVQLGDTVLVQGSGPIGILAAKQAKLEGAGRVLITGRKDAKLNLAMSLGIDGAINLTRETTAEGIRRCIGAPKVDKIIEASGSAALFTESLGLINGGGILSVVAFYDRPLDHFDIDKFVFSDISIVSVPGSLGMFPIVLKLMAMGILDCTPLITERIKLPQVIDMLPNLKKNAESRVKVMIEVD